VASVAILSFLLGNLRIRRTQNDYLRILFLSVKFKQLKDQKEYYPLWVSQLMTVKSGIRIQYLV
jgi:hypothetical protein